MSYYSSIEWDNICLDLSIFLIEDITAPIHCFRHAVYRMKKLKKAQVLLKCLSSRQYFLHRVDSSIVSWFSSNRVLHLTSAGSNISTIDLLELMHPTSWQSIPRTKIPNQTLISKFRNERPKEKVGMSLGACWCAGDEWQNLSFHMYPQTPALCIF